MASFAPPTGMAERDTNSADRSQGEPGDKSRGDSGGTAPDSGGASRGDSGDKSRGESGGTAQGPFEEWQRLFEEAEGRTAEAMERLVRRDSFGELLAQITDNALALTRIGTGMFDMAVRNLRIAGRQDITNLGRQLARTEDKLERVLQEVERLQEQLDSGTAEAHEGSGGGSGAGSEAGPGRNEPA